MLVSASVFARHVVVAIAVSHTPPVAAHAHAFEDVALVEVYSFAIIAQWCIILPWTHAQQHFVAGDEHIFRDRCGGLVHWTSVGTVNPQRATVETHFVEAVGIVASP